MLQEDGSRSWLIVCSDPELLPISSSVKFLVETLSRKGLTVHEADNGNAALKRIQNDSYDVILTDVKMPGRSGMDILKHVRETARSTVVIIMTAYATVESAVEAMKMGAFDYLIKPFAFNELLARIRALLRRESLTKTPRLEVGKLVMDTLTREVWYRDKLIELTNKEYIIMEYFMRHPNMVISRTMLENHAWDYEFDSISNLIDVYIRKLVSFECLARRFI